jgi:hypothetical protein
MQSIRRWVEKELFATPFIIQQIGVDPAILNANQAIYVKSRQAQMAMEEQRLSNEPSC